MTSLALPEVVRRALYLPPEATPTARQVDLLHATIIGLTFAGVLVLSSLTFYYLARYRRKGPPSPTTHVQASKARELGTAAAIGFFFIALWFVGYRQYISIEEPPADAMVVYVTAKQWMWTFAYPDGTRTRDVLVVPEHRAVMLIMTSRDVIHSFYVPAFRIKQDVIPGRFVTAWIDHAEPGAYPLRCAEFCGLSHSRMLGEVRVVDADEYARFLRDGTRDEDLAASLVERGREVASEKGCFACHTIDGQKHIGPTWSRLYGSSVVLRDGRTMIADPAYLTRSMMEPATDIVAGFQNVMPSYAGRLDPAESAALVEFIRSLEYEGPAPVVALPPASAEAAASGGVPAEAPR
jgi:cytochrome c oxidase subunit 2